MRKKILLIEGNRKVLEILAFALGREGYEIIRSDDGLTGIRLAEEQSPDLIVLDLMPSTVSDCDVMSTLDVCRSLRQENIKATILAFTISEEEKDELRDAGADDYIHKPFTMRELLSKVRTNTWHLVMPTVGRAGIKKRQMIGRIIIDPEQLLVLRDGKALDLTQREYDLLSFLAREPGKVFSREELLRHVWDYTSYMGDIRAVDVGIRRLREKIEDDPANPTIIITKRGRGYFIASGL